MAQAEATDHWIRYTQEGTNRPYYHNSRTGETTWEQPPAVPVTVQYIPPTPVVGIPAASYLHPGQTAHLPRPTVSYADIMCCFSCLIPALKYEDETPVYPGEPSEEPIEWPTDFCFGYCCWQDPRRNRSICAPTCFPWATILPCSVMGSSVSLMAEEEFTDGCKGCCEDSWGCQMGPEGNSMCLGLSIFGFLPFGVGLICVLGTVCAERRFVMQRHNVQHKDNCFCWMLGCCWPCAVMQHYILLRSFNHKHGILPLAPMLLDERTPLTAAVAVEPVLALPITPPPSP